MPSDLKVHVHTSLACFVSSPFTIRILSPSQFKGDGSLGPLSQNRKWDRQYWDMATETQTSAGLAFLPDHARGKKRGAAEVFHLVDIGGTSFIAPIDSPSALTSMGRSIGKSGYARLFVSRAAAEVENQTSSCMFHMPCRLVD